MLGFGDCEKSCTLQAASFSPCSGLGKALTSEYCSDLLQHLQVQMFPKIENVAEENRRLGYPSDEYGASSYDQVSVLRESSLMI